MLWPFMLAAGLTSGLQGATHEGEGIMLRRVRGVDTSMRATIAEGCARSPVFAGLVRNVERSHFIVYVEAVLSVRNGMKGALLHGTGGATYLRIHLKRDLPVDRQVAVLAHELQHVREVMQAGISAHAAEMEMLFRRIGGTRLSGGRRQQFETAAALRVGDAVAADLSTKRGDGRRVNACRADTPNTQ